MFRRVARQGLKNEDVRPYLPSDLKHELATDGSDRHPPQSFEVELESLDLIELAPYWVLLAAQEKAQALIAQAEQMAEEIRNAAQRQGNAQGREAAKQDLLPSLVAFADAAQALIVFEEQLVSRSTPEIVQLALEIAEKVIGKAMDEDGQIAAAILERAKHEVMDAKQIRIWLHPDDFRFLAEVRPDVVRMGDETGRKIEVMASEDVTRGGCRLETEMGLLDATVPTQLEELRRQLLGDDAQNAVGVIPRAKSS